MWKGGTGPRAERRGTKVNSYVDTMLRLVCSNGREKTRPPRRYIRAPRKENVSPGVRLDDPFDGEGGPMTVFWQCGGTFRRGRGRIVGCVGATRRRAGNFPCVSAYQKHPFHAIGELENTRIVVHLLLHVVVCGYRRHTGAESKFLSRAVVRQGDHVRQTRPLIAHATANVRLFVSF